MLQLSCKSLCCQPSFPSYHSHLPTWESQRLPEVGQGHRTAIRETAFYHHTISSHLGNLPYLPPKAIPGLYTRVDVQDKLICYEICMHSIYQVGHEQSPDNTKDLYLFSREAPSECQQQGRSLSKFARSDFSTSCSHFNSFSPVHSICPFGHTAALRGKLLCPERAWHCTNVH